MGQGMSCPLSGECEMEQMEVIQGGMVEFDNSFRKAVCAVEAAQEQLGKAIDDLHIQADFQNPTVTMPFMWSKSDGLGGPRVENPLTIDFELSNGHDSGLYVWRTDLRGLINAVVEFHVLRDGSVPREIYDGTIMPIANDLQALADKLRAIPVTD